MISVILTTHNGRKDVCKRAIESVRRQTTLNWELIVVDDASKDGTEEMVQGIKDQRIKYVRLKRNFGNDTKPKNTGILESKGDFIAFLDSDNEYRPDHLAVLYKALENNPKVDLVYGNRWVINDAENRPMGLGRTQDYKPGALMEMNYIDTSDVMIRRQALYDVGGWDERFGKYVDWNLWVRMEKYGHTFLHVPMVITDYHLSTDSKSTKKFTKNEEKFTKNNPGMFRNIPDWDPIDVEIELPYLDEKPEPRVAIFSITYDRLEYTKKCFEQMYKTAGYAFDHYIVDNGSTDGTSVWLESREQFKASNLYLIEFEALLNNGNVGISKASNQALDSIDSPLTIQGLDKAMDENPKVTPGDTKEQYDIIIKVDNDCYFHNQGWLAKMVELWKSNHRLALSPYIQGLRDNPGGAPRVGYGQIKGELLGLTEHLGGICVMTDAKAYKNFRWADDDFLHGVQDLEFSQHLRRQGYQLAYMENWFADHLDGTEGQHAKYPEYFERRKKEKNTRYAHPA